MTKKGIVFEGCLKIESDQGNISRDVTAHAATKKPGCWPGFFR
jgi:hypothetical protein